MLETAHEDAVGDDKSDKHRELLGCIVGECFEHLVDDDHESGHHHKLHDDANVGGNCVADERYDDVGEGQDSYDRYAHDDGRFELCRYRKH